ELLATMGTRILRGRDISRDDREHAPRVIVINETMAKKLWPNQDPIGKTLRIDSDTSPVTTVVGIAEDVRRGSLNEPEAHYYLPIDQIYADEGGFFVRTVGRPDDYTESVRHVLQTMMPGVSYVTVTPMAKIMAYKTRPWELGATMFVVFGALALVLA